MGTIWAIKPNEYGFYNYRAVGRYTPEQASAYVEQHRENYKRMGAILFFIAH